MAWGTSSLPHAPHSHLRLLAQPGRAVVRAADRQETAPRRTPVNPGPGERHSRLDHQLERQPETLHLDQDRRRDPRTPRLIYSTDPWRRTLAGRGRVAEDVGLRSDVVVAHVGSRAGIVVGLRSWGLWVGP